MVSRFCVFWIKKHHQEGDDRGRGIDDELPRVAIAEHRPGQRPHDHKSVAIKNAIGLPVQCAVAQAATVNISDQVLFFGSHVLDVLSACGCSERTAAGFSLFDVVRARGMLSLDSVRQVATPLQCGVRAPVPRWWTAQELNLRAAVFLMKRRRRKTVRRIPMLGWALTFLVVALIAAVLGFGGIAGLSIEIAKIIFSSPVVLFLISAVIGLVRGRSPTVP
jgi:uncharacterized membrane protein YtjA (UPF0391 family)